MGLICLENLALRQLFKIKSFKFELIFNLQKIYRTESTCIPPPTFPNISILPNRVTIFKCNIGPTNNRKSMLLSFYYLRYRSYLNSASFFH